MSWGELIQSYQLSNDIQQFVLILNNNTTLTAVCMYNFSWRANIENWFDIFILRVHKGAKHISSNVMVQPTSFYIGIETKSFSSFQALKIRSV